MQSSRYHTSRAYFPRRYTVEARNIPLECLCHYLFPVVDLCYRARQLVHPFSLVLLVPVSLAIDLHLVAWSPVCFSWLCVDGDLRKTQKRCIQEEREYRDRKRDQRRD
jgi:hypothetical protein